MQIVMPADCGSLFKLDIGDGNGEACGEARGEDLGDFLVFG